MATETAEERPSVGEAAAAAVAPDPVTAELLHKHSAGQRLSPSEYGKLGAFKARLKSVFTSKGGDKEPVVAPGAPEDPGQAVAPCDPDLARRTTAAILKSSDQIVRRYVTRQARAAGADDRSVARFDSAAALPPATQELMVDVSPDVLVSLGIDPRSYPVVAFLGGLGLWSTNVWLVVDELKALAEKAESAKTAAAAAAAPTTNGKP